MSAAATEGQRREAQARRHLEAAGLKLRAANVRYRFGELDLVMDEGETLVFVEVRYRRAGSHGGAIESVGAAKRQRLWKAAQAFLAAQPALSRRPCRFDLVAIEGEARLQWLRGVIEGEAW
jgi:putative endonuclease